jgi:hypothetical protein
MTVVMLVLGLLVGFGVIFTAVFVVLSRVARKSENEARKQHPDARHIEAGALFFGQESRGAAQMRGNGTLILTSSELVFKQWVVGREFRVRYQDIESIDMPTSFLGKTQGVSLLRVNYLNESGSRDAMAWRVRDPNGLKRSLDEARSSVTSLPSRAEPS